MDSQLKSKNIQAICNSAVPLQGSAADLDPLLERIGARPVVLIGAASHGSQEFYQLRAAITRRLVAEKGFAAVIIEADWAGVLRINRYACGMGTDQNAQQALGELRHFPRWMWRNTEAEQLIEWLRRYNRTLTRRPPVRLYGLDLFSLYSAMQAVITSLDRRDHEGAERAGERFACFDQLGRRPEAYGRGFSIGLHRDCTREALEQLVALHRDAARHLASEGLVPEDELLCAEQASRFVQGARSYYRKMFEWPDLTWNLRERQMSETLEAVLIHLRRQGLPPKVVVWAHNSHLGDARATEVAQEGQISVGQLARERYGDGVFLIGQTTYSGTVAAAPWWGGPLEQRRLSAALADSVEDLLHQSGIPAFMLWPEEPGLSSALGTERLQRAIGVVYRPETERQSHYLTCRLAHQFDAVLHTDETSALLPLDLVAGLPAEQHHAPETWTAGI